MTNSSTQLDRQIVGTKPDHIVGTETEHDIFNRRGHVSYTSVLQQLLNLNNGIRVNFRRWLRSGGLAYLDMAGKVEYAGPECFTGTEAMIYELQGSLLWALLAFYADRAAGFGGETWVLKTNTSMNGASSGGNHINLSMPTLPGCTYDELLEKAMTPLKAFVVTFQLFTGSGVVLPFSRANTRLGTDEYRYAISPRGFHVYRNKGAAYNNAAEGNKPIFILRDEPLADPLRFWRLQIAGLDSNILPEVIQLKLDLLLLMVEMVVAHAIVPLELVDEEGPNFSVSRISRNWRAPLQVKDRGIMTALEIQWEYFQQAKTFVDNRGGQGSEILLQWIRILRAFKTEEDIPAALFGKVDWVTKAVMLKQRAAKLRRPLSYAEAEQLHFAYQGYRFSTSGLCLPVRLMRRYGPPDINRAVWRAMDTPPVGTRAEARSRFVGAGFPDAEVGWDFVQVKPSSAKFLLTDPTVPTTPEFETLMASYGGAGG